MGGGEKVGISCNINERSFLFFAEFILFFLRVRSHQASASTQCQCCGDACDIVLIEMNRVTPKWVRTLIFPLISIEFFSNWL